MGYASDPIYTRPVKQVITVETPMGPKEFEYGRYIRGDMLTGTYRSQDVSGSTVASLLVSIQRIEDEFLTTKKRDAKRKEVAKNPVTAHLVIYSGDVDFKARRKDGKRPIRFEIEEVKVRGIDLRSGGLMITRANGDKETVERRSTSVLVNYLDGGDYEDVVAAWRHYQPLAETVPAERSAQEVFSEILGITETKGSFTTHSKTVNQIEVEVHFDPETSERVATYDGQTFRAKDARAIDEAITSYVLNQYGWTLTSGRSFGNGAGEVVGPHKSLSSFDTVWRSMEDYQAYADAKQAAKDALATFEGLLKDHSFDRSLVEVPADEPEPDVDLLVNSQTGDLIEVPHIQAPDYEPEWEV